MHGDISQGEFGVTPDEIDYAVHRAKRFIRDELQGQATVIVGYEGESGPLNAWLARAPGEVWWVHAEPPPGSLRLDEYPMAATESFRPVRGPDRQTADPALYAATGNANVRRGPV